ncbi:MAG: polyprenyl diphosphate synthase, partial [Halobacteriaceae archaeon]
QHLFNLIEEKLYEFADKDRIHNEEVHIQVIGETSRLPTDVQDAITYAEQQTHDYDRFRLNIAIAYGGREELLSTARDIAIEVKDGNINPSDIDVNTFAKRIHDGPVRDVDLIIRTGGDERTSNFLPWHANGNEAAVFFCTPYWPEFSKIDFLRGIRTYESREESWRQAKVQRALALLRAFGGVELEEAKRILTRFKDSVPDHEPDVVSSDQRPNRR